jgi:DnaJ-class molecular chaperone
VGDIERAISGCEAFEKEELIRSYEILGVHCDATDEEVKTALRAYSRLR